MSLYKLRTIPHFIRVANHSLFHRDNSCTTCNTVFGCMAGHVPVILGAEQILLPFDKHAGCGVSCAKPIHRGICSCTLGQAWLVLDLGSNSAGFEARFWHVEQHFLRPGPSNSVGGRTSASGRLLKRRNRSSSRTKAGVFSMFSRWSDTTWVMTSSPQRA